MLKETCGDMDAQMEQRVKTRAAETEAVSKAMTILTADDARDNFSKTLGFIQTSSTQNDSRRARAAKVLMTAAKKLGAPALAALATKVKLNAFTELQKALDK